MSTEPINRENLVQAQQNQAERHCVHPDDEMNAKVISRARVSVEFADIDLHDKAAELLDSLRVGDINADLEADYYDCPLCGATMFVSIDYTHKTDCPSEVFGRAIDVFSSAVRAALPALPKPSDEEAQPTQSNPTAENSHDTR